VDSSLDSVIATRISITMAVQRFKVEQSFISKEDFALVAWHFLVYSNFI
jgi:hypothetical protein